MAYTVDVANVGTNQGDGGGASPDLTLTTSSAVASGTAIFLAVGHDCGGVSGTGTHSVSGGGLTWNEVGKGQDVSSGGIASFFYALAPSGLASSTVLTWSTTATTIWGYGLCASSYVGNGFNTIGTSDVNTATSGTTWASDSTALTGASMLITGVMGRQPTAHSATAGTEDNEQLGNGYVDVAIVRRFESTSASFTTGGTFNATYDSMVAITWAFNENAGAVDTAKPLRPDFARGEFPFIPANTNPWLPR